MRGISDNERQWLGHMTMWGSDGYPVRKVGRGWIFDDFFGVKGTPTVYRTKRQATAAVEAFEGILIDAIAGRI